MDELRQWKCANGHVLGVVQRLRVDGFHVSQLLLFRHAVDLGAGSLEDVDVLTTVEGVSHEVRCDVPGCGGRRTWHLGQDVARKVVSTYAAE